MSTKMSSRPRKHKHKDDMKQETVAQVHKTVKSDTSSDEKNKKNEDKNDNYSTNTPSRDVSVDEESQINSKILSLIESEMKRDANKHSHFTDSRPQSLSFYEDEKIPEELSGNLELLSPEERKHYKRRRELDTDEMNAYNVIQDLYGSRDGDEIISSTKKSKSRKKRHGDTEIGIGDSREMMIPKEKKKSKKKKRESSPGTGKRKHKKRDEEFEPRNDITVALEELQDDVFENNEEFNKVEKVKKSPKKSEKVYVQKKNKFEAVSRPNNLNRQSAYDFEEDLPGKNFQTYHPLELAVSFQKYWMRLTTLCHGLLGGLAFGHWLYIISNIYVQDGEFISHYSHFSDTYVSFFYFLCVICLISVFEKIDIAHFERSQFRSLFHFRKSSIVIVVYFTCLVVHLSAARIDYKLGLVSYNNETISNITRSELTQWNHLSLWRSVLAFLAWIIVGLSPQDNMFYDNLRSMENYLPHK
ncbi:hypothetical protein Zmor_009913 [Zophobas morio]|uniref:Transmembrane protein 237 n=1 Tax=Zophobas morio TaxID=2755281 RepID=A0AA38IJV0_9CUCU|nr:hypothetical protein Zmor_009913 [Zophobas morio]